MKMGGKAKNLPVNMNGSELQHNGGGEKREGKFIFATTEGARGL